MSQLKRMSAPQRYRPISAETVTTAKVDFSTLSLDGQSTLFSSAIRSFVCLLIVEITGVHLPGLCGMASREKGGRGDRFRTRDLRIWNPLLYQLSYSPAGCPKEPGGAGPPPETGLLGFSVWLVPTAGTAEFFELQLARGGLFVLGRAVVLPFAFCTLQMDYVAHGEVPLQNPHSITSSTRPEPTVRPPSRMANLRPFSMAMGHISSTVSVTLSPGITISRPSSRVMEPVTSVVRK